MAAQPCSLQQRMYTEEDYDPVVLTPREMSFYDWLLATEPMPEGPWTSEELPSYFAATAWSAAASP
jgi:hypothetical protein